jgi:DNA processing protein
MNNIRYWLALNNLPGVGSVTIGKCLERVPNIEELFIASPENLASAGIPAPLIELLKNPNWTAVDKALEWQASNNLHHIISLENEAYPILLKQIASAPAILYVRGNLAALSQNQLAMVGTRTPSQKGKEIAFEFARHLASENWVITSGLALGIDAACHEGTLAAEGKTIAVLGTGVDQIYPKQHRALAEEILNQEGAIVSEFALGTQPKPENFPRRNRIISGLSLGTIVIEAALKSGSLITARYALEQNREVFAMPGSIHNPLARGCHYLIRQGAKLVETAEDILEELAVYYPIVGAPLVGARIKHNDNASLGQPQGIAPTKNTKITTASKLPPLDSSHQTLLEQIDYEPTPIDVLVKRTGLSIPTISSMVLSLEIEGYIGIGQGGGYYRK